MKSNRWWLRLGLWLGLSLGLSPWAAPLAWAGQYVLQAGQANTVPVAARVLNGLEVCNLTISVPGQDPFEREVRAPFFDTRITLTPVNVDSVTVRWQGQFKRVDGRVVNACPTQGEARFQVEADNALTRALWAGMLTELNRASPSQAECVHAALAHDQIRPEWFDFTDPQVSAEDAKIERAFTQCDRFVAQPKAWGSQNPLGHACTVGGIATRCEGFYTARTQGKVQNISQTDAMLRQLQDLPWGSVVREIAKVRASRIRQDKDRLAQLAAQEAAQLQAEEDARIQAEQSDEDAKAAEQAALQERIAALRTQIAESKARAATERNWVLQQVDKLTGKAPADAASGAEAPAATAPATAAPASLAPAATAPADASPAAAPAPADEPPSVAPASGDAPAVSDA